MSRKRKLVKIYYQNIRGMRTKVNDIRSNILTTDYDIITLTETWLNDSFQSSEFFNNSYFVERHDRQIQGVDRGGGVLIAVKNHIPYTRMHVWEQTVPLDCIWINIKDNSSQSPVFINVVYIPPNSRYEIYERYFDHLSEIVCNAEPNAKFIILGDFNMGGSISWQINNNFECEIFSHEGNIATEFVNTLSLTDFKQFNHFRNNLGRILDYALSNISGLIIDSTTPISTVDPQHPPFSVSLSSFDIKYITPQKSNKFNYFKANYSLINQELAEIDWNMEFSTIDFEHQVDRFYELTSKIIESHTPIITPKDNKYPKWFTKKLIELINDKIYFLEKFRQTKLPVFNEIYKKKRRELKYELRACEIKYTSTIEELIPTNTKAFFDYTKSLKKSNKLPNRMKLNGTSSDNPTEIANLFADHFKSVYTPTDNSIHLCDLNCNCDNHYEISDEHIALAINSLDQNKTNSPDNIPAIFYMNTINNIVTPLRLLYNQSLRLRVFPAQWKLSLITPIHKSGDKSDILNYRPISIIPTISKIFEKIMHNYLHEQIQNLIATEQHGFVKGKSTITNLAEYVNFLATNMPGGAQIDAIYTDLAKAFDKINHRVLINKLNNFPINNCIKSWILSFLTNRKQLVCIYGTKSKPIYPTSSVPQGCTLSTLLFALFINDLPSIFKSSSLLFADDLKIYRKINSFQDCLTLQNDLNMLTRWCNENKLNLNVPKCTVVSFTRCSNRKFQLFNYHINNTPLNRSSVVKDLGIIFDQKLTFIQHVNSIVLRASRSMGFICRSLKPFNNINTHKILYFTYVRSILEYGSQIWNPFYHIHTSVVENVQRKFTRIICYKFHLPRGTYESRLNLLNMHSLANRRLFSDELLLYKIISGRSNTNLSSELTPYTPARLTRNAPYFYLRAVNTNVEMFSLVLRLKTQHNDYFNDIDLNNRSISAVKRAITYSLPSEEWTNVR